MNLGLISTQKDFTSSTTDSRSYLLYKANFFTSSVQALSFFLIYFADKIKDAAAISDGLNFKRLASNKATSWMYWAKKNTSLSWNTAERREYLSRNLYDEGDVNLKLRVCKMSFSMTRTYSLWNLFSLTASKSLRSGGYISSYFEEIKSDETPSKWRLLFKVFFLLKN